MSKILMVCLGNICRSPTAEAVLRKRLADRMITDIDVDSAGTGDWHIGNPPDPRAIAAGASRDYDLTPLRARQVTAADFECFTHILAMDRDNLRNLQKLAPAGHTAELKLFLDYAGYTDKSVPDPYFGGADGFQTVLDLIEEATDGLIISLNDGKTPQAASS